MALPLVLRKHAKFGTVMKLSIRNAALWNHVWRPGPVPKTEEERIACAKKYGLIPADYDTYPDDGAGFGDYPKFDPTSSESRDPHALYDFPELKRNFGEPFHVDQDMYGEDRLDISGKLHRPLSHLYLHFFGIVGGLWLAMAIGENLRITCLKMMPRHEPFQLQNGKQYYSFDLVPKEK